MLQAISSFSGIAVDTIEKARAFYGDTLGLALEDESMGLTFALPGGGSLFIYEKPGHTPAEYTVLNFVVENITDTIRHLVDDHALIFERYDGLPAPQDELGVLRGKATGDGPDIAWFKDPAGNILAVLET